MFRFEDLDVWQKAIKLNDKIFDLSDIIYKEGHHRFAEQLRSASLSICNNIAEGAGSSSKVEFKQFLGFAHRSCFEVANMIYIAGNRRLIINGVKKELLTGVEVISKMLTNLRKRL